MQPRHFVLFLFGWVLAPLLINGQALRRPGIVPNGVVYDLLRSGDTTYYAGQFTRAGYYSAYLGFSQQGAEEPALDAPMTNGAITCAIADGQGGWYLGGNFTQIGDESVRYLAHLDANRALDLTFQPEPNGPVQALLLRGDTLYVGGNFTQISGQGQAYLVALDLGQGQQPMTWLPAFNGAVDALQYADGGTLYVGGNFTEVGDVAQRYFAEIGVPSGQVVQTLSTNGRVSDIERQGDEVYLGGSFTQAGHYAPYAAVISPDSTFPDRTLPTFNGSLRAIIPDGNGGWYVGGSFTQVGGQAFPYLVRLQSDLSVDPTFTPAVNGAVRALRLYLGKLYVGGSFTQLGGQSRPYVGRIDLATNSLEGWNPQPNGPIYSLDLSGNGQHVYLGGTFSLVADQRQLNFAVIDRNSGDLIPSLSVNGAVYAMDHSPFALGGTGYTYLGGAFTQGGYYAPFAARLSSDTQPPDIDFPTLNGAVEVIISDGNGGWYLGGNFTQVDGQSRPYLVRIGSDNSVDPDFTPAPNGPVRSLVRSGNLLYAGGSFTQIGGQSIGRIAALDGSTGQLAPGWLSQIGAGANGTVSALALTGSTLYLGGSFTQVSGQGRSNLAALDATSGSLQSFAPALNGAVFALLYTSNTLYVGGAFTQISGQIVRYLTAYNSSGTRLSNFAPDPNNVVRALDLVGGNLRVGGAFSSIGGQPRSHLAELTLSNGTATPWNVGTNGQVYDIEGSYIVGAFTTVGGQPRPYAATVLSNGTVGSWRPDLNNPAHTIWSGSGEVMLGGSFSYTQHRLRRYLGAFFPLDNRFTDSWTVDANNVVNVLKVVDTDYLYIGGAFSQVGGQPRQRLAELGVQNPGGVSLWNPTLNGAVNDLSWRQDTVYVAGSFTEANGQARPYLAAFTNRDHVNDTLLSWNPQANQVAQAIDWQGGRILTGGSFTYLKYARRRYLMSYSHADKTTLAWDPGTNNVVNDLLLDSSHLYVAGAFSQVAGQPRRALVRFGAVAGGQPTFDLGWDAELPSGAQINTVVRRDQEILAGGRFDDLVQGQPRRHVAAFAVSDGSLQPWRLQPDQSVSQLVQQGASLLVGGRFTFWQSEDRRNLMAVDEATGRIVAGWAPEANSAVRRLRRLGDHLYLGGTFTQVNGQPRNYLARVDRLAGTMDLWHPNLNGPVEDMVVANGQLHVGGSFTQVGNQAQAYLAAFDPSSAQPTSWTPQLDATVEALALSGQQLYVGGNFTQIDNQPRERLARFDLSGGSLSTWTQACNGRVSAIAPSGSRIYVGGTFTQVAGQNRRYLAALSPSNGALQPWEASPNGSVDALLARDTLLLVGGAMTELGNQSVGYGGIVSVGSGSLLGNFQANNRIGALLDLDSLVAVGGNFTAVGEEPRARYYARYDVSALRVGIDTTVLSRPAEPEESWQVYPNPAREEVLLRRPARWQGKTLQVELFTPDGRRVAAQPLGPEAERVLLPRLPAGLYWLQVKGAEQLFQQRLLIRP